MLARSHVSPAAFIGGAILSALAPSYQILLAGRCIQGISLGLSTSIMYFLIFTEIPRRQLGVFSGLASMIISFSPAIGPSCGGVISQEYGWRAVFWAILPIAILGGLLNEIATRNTPKGVEGSFNVGLLALVAVGMALLDVSASLVGNDDFGWVFWCAAALGVGALAAFVAINRRSANPLFDLGVFRVPAVRWAVLAYFFLAFVNLGFSVSIPSYAQYVLHSSISLSGWIVCPGAIAGAVIAPLAGAVADRRGFRLPILCGAVVLAVGAVLFPTLQWAMTPTLIVLLYVLVRLGWNVAFASVLSDATTLIPEQSVADLNAIGNTAQQFAGSFGAVLISALVSVDELTVRGDMTQRVYDGSHVAFLALAGVSCAALLCLVLDFAVRGKRR